MTKRLNIERQQKLEPKRLEFAKAKLMFLGYTVETTETEIKFIHKGNEIKYFPYSGWHQGKGIKPGRGLNNLIKQLV